MPTALQPLRWQAFHQPKRGHSEEEYEDAFAANAERGRFAVADGASESSFAGIWARHLTNGFVSAARRPWSETGWLEPLRQQWAEEVGRLPLPWYAEMKRQEGAFATFLGMAIRRPNHSRAVAIGDCCLIQLRENELIHSFPLLKAEEFGNHPALVGSKIRLTGAWQAPARKITGTWQPGDLFLLTTDALAQWLLQQHERNQQPWKQLRPFLEADASAADFAALVEDTRNRGEIKNDDVTLMMAESPPATAAQTRFR